jgi:hypothetical protein
MGKPPARWRRKSSGERRVTSGRAQVTGFREQEAQKRRQVTSDEQIAKTKFPGGKSSPWRWRSRRRGTTRPFVPREKTGAEKDPACSAGPALRPCGFSSGADSYRAANRSIRTSTERAAQPAPRWKSRKAGKRALRYLSSCVPRRQRVATVSLRRPLVTVGFSFDHKPTVNSKDRLAVATSGSHNFGPRSVPT